MRSETNNAWTEGSGEDPRRPSGSDAGLYTDNSKSASEGQTRSQSRDGSTRVPAQRSSRGLRPSGRHVPDASPPPRLPATYAAQVKKGNTAFTFTQAAAATSTQGEEDDEAADRRSGEEEGSASQPVFELDKEREDSEEEGDEEEVVESEEQYDDDDGEGGDEEDWDSVEDDEEGEDAGEDEAAAGARTLHFSSEEGHADSSSGNAPRGGFSFPFGASTTAKAGAFSTSASTVTRPTEIFGAPKDSGNAFRRATPNPRAAYSVGYTAPQGKSSEETPKPSPAREEETTNASPFATSSAAKPFGSFTNTGAFKSAFAAAPSSVKGATSFEHPTAASFGAFAAEPVRAAAGQAPRAFCAPRPAGTAFGAPQTASAAPFGPFAAAPLEGSLPQRTQNFLPTSGGAFGASMPSQIPPQSRPLGDPAHVFAARTENAFGASRVGNSFAPAAGTAFGATTTPGLSAVRHADPLSTAPATSSFFTGSNNTSGTNTAFGFGNSNGGGAAPTAGPAFAGPAFGGGQAPASRPFGLTSSQPSAFAASGPPQQFQSAFGASAGGAHHSLGTTTTTTAKPFGSSSNTGIASATPLSSAFFGRADAPQPFSAAPASAPIAPVPGYFAGVVKSEPQFASGATAPTNFASHGPALAPAFGAFGGGFTGAAATTAGVATTTTTNKPALSKYSFVPVKQSGTHPSSTHAFSAAAAASDRKPFDFSQKAPAVSAFGEFGAATTTAASSGSGLSRAFTSLAHNTTAAAPPTTTKEPSADPSVGHVAAAGMAPSASTSSSPECPQRPTVGATDLRDGAASAQSSSVDYSTMVASPVFLQEDDDEGEDGNAGEEDVKDGVLKTTAAAASAFSAPLSHFSFREGVQDAEKSTTSSKKNVGGGGCSGGGAGREAEEEGGDRVQHSAARLTAAGRSATVEAILSEMADSTTAAEILTSACEREEGSERPFSGVSTAFSPLAGATPVPLDGVTVVDPRCISGEKDDVGEGSEERMSEPPRRHDTPLEEHELVVEETQVQQSVSASRPSPHTRVLPPPTSLNVTITQVYNHTRQDAAWLASSKTQQQQKQQMQQSQKAAVEAKEGSSLKVALYSRPLLVHLPNPPLRTSLMCAAGDSGALRQLVGAVQFTFGRVVPAVVRMVVQLAVAVVVVMVGAVVLDSVWNGFPMMRLWVAEVQTYLQSLPIKHIRERLRNVWE